MAPCWSETLSQIPYLEAREYRGQCRKEAVVPMALAAVSARMGLSKPP
jgi:hypothetical protein